MTDVLGETGLERWGKSREALLTINTTLPTGRCTCGSVPGKCGGRAGASAEKKEEERVTWRFYRFPPPSSPSTHAHTLAHLGLAERPVRAHDKEHQVRARHVLLRQSLLPP
eukprot:361022-Chlamydomonas_euryale.AAC.4